MEQHPIPRNISSFQFHLIGDMTVRQFAYLAGGVLLAFIIFKVELLPAIIKIPIAVIIALSGVAFAFLPIQERPLDRWLAAFIKSIFSPSQYLWHKDSAPPEILTKLTTIHSKNLAPVQVEAHRDARDKLRNYLNTLPSQPHQTLNSQEKSYIDNTLILFNTAYKSSTSATQQASSMLAQAMDLSSSQAPMAPISVHPISTPTIAKPPAVAQKVTISPIVPETKLPAPPPTPQIKVETKADSDEVMQHRLKALASEKEVLSRELAALRQEINKDKGSNIVKPQLSPEEKVIPSIKTVSARAAVNEIGLPQLPQTPNVISGVVKDAQKKILPNVILTVKDFKGLPIRALKTNKLGLFVTATPLPNGTYLLEAEDPLKRYHFDIAQITVDGKVFLPIEISAKGEKEIMREKLAKEVFGSASI